jgi:hypothetical protein
MITLVASLRSLDPFTMTEFLAYGSLVVAAVILLYYLIEYVRFVLNSSHSRGWWYLEIGVAAGVIYGVSGLLYLATSIPWISLIKRGGVLFFILFLSLGMRALYVVNSNGTSSDRRKLWVDYVAIGGIVLVWWAGFLSNREPWIMLVETVIWGGATLWVIRYGVLTVRTHEGTSFSAVVRHLLPAVISFVAVVFSDLIGYYTEEYTAVVDAIWVIGTVLVAAFLFNTAVAIRQQGAEVGRKYDWTTWRG